MSREIPDVYELLTPRNDSSVRMLRCIFSRELTRLCIGHAKVRETWA